MKCWLDMVVLKKNNTKIMYFGVFFLLLNKKGI
jgi:hypothetical protein